MFSNCGRWANLGGGPRRPFRQLPHLIGDDGKASPLFTCPCRFNGSVEGEKIGLIRDVADDAHDLSDLLRLLAERLHHR